jgi:Uma2 family endonuclease
MRTVLLGKRPPEVEDLYDEVWGGEYHMAPAPHGRHGQVDFELAAILRPLARRAGLRGSGPANIGTPDDYRVPDQSFFADQTPQTFNPTAEIVIEIVSPDDESRNKFDFYFRAGVKEVAIVDPNTRKVEWYTRGDSGFWPADGSPLLGISAAELTRKIDWPR